MDGYDSASQRVSSSRCILDVVDVDICVVLTILDILEADASGLVIRKKDGDQDLDYGPHAALRCVALRCVALRCSPGLNSLSNT